MVGHSFGTMVTTALALNHPERLRGIALLGGYYYPTPRADVLLVAPSAIPGIGDVLRHTFMPLLGEALKPRFNAKMFGPAEPTRRGGTCSPGRWRCGRRGCAPAPPTRCRWCPPPRGWRRATGAQAAGDDHGRARRPAGDPGAQSERLHRRCRTAAST